MHQARVKQDHRTGGAFRRDDAALVDEPADCLVVDGPQRIAGGCGVVFGVDHAALVAARNEHQRPVELVDVAEKDRHVHRPRLWHQIVVLPRAVILVPLPDVSVEGHLAVDLELMHVHRLTQELLDRLNHARMASEFRELPVVKVRGEVRAHGIAAFLANVLCAALGIERGNFIEESRDLLRRKQRRQKQIPVAVELLYLLFAEVHWTPL